MLLLEHKIVKSVLQPESNQTFVDSMLTRQARASGLNGTILILILLQTFDSPCLLLYAVQLPLTVSFTLIMLEMFIATMASFANAKV